MSTLRGHFVGSIPMARRSVSSCSAWSCSLAWLRASSIACRAACTGSVACTSPKPVAILNSTTRANPIARFISMLSEWENVFTNSLKPIESERRIHGSASFDQLGKSAAGHVANGTLNNSLKSPWEFQQCARFCRWTGTVVRRFRRGECAAEKDIVDTAVDAGSFKTLIAAVKAAGLAEKLKGDGPFTVLRPRTRPLPSCPRERWKRC